MPDYRVNQVLVLFVLVEPAMVTSWIVCSPDMVVNFKPTGCLLRFMDCLFTVGSASVHPQLNSNTARVLMLHDCGYYQADWPLILLQKTAILMNPLYVGIDVSSKSNMAFPMKPDGSKHSCFSVKNSLDGSASSLSTSSMPSLPNPLQTSSLVWRPPPSIVTILSAS